MSRSCRSATRRVPAPSSPQFGSSLVAARAFSDLQRLVSRAELGFAHQDLRARPIALAIDLVPARSEPGKDAHRAVADRLFVDGRIAEAFLGHEREVGRVGT